MSAKSILSLFVILALTLFIGCTDELKYKNSSDSSKGWKLDEFFIYAGWPLEVDCPDDEALIKALADLDYNVIMWDSSKLELCKKYNLKLMIDHGQKGWDPPGDSRWAQRWREYMKKVGPLTPEMAASHIGDDDVWGYSIFDEPKTEQYEDMRAQQVVFNEADPTHPAYINLFSGGGDYLAKFMETVQPNILSYDFYQWWWGREGHFTNLEQYRAAALAADIPLFCWVEINANKDSERGGGPPPADNVIKLRQSVYTNLAYGVKGIEWFTTPNIFEHGTANVTSAGKDVGVINKELKKIGPELVKLQSTEVFHTEPVPAGTKKLPANHWAQSETEDIVLGFFKEKNKTRPDYIMAANKSIENESSVLLKFTQPVSKVKKFDKIKGKWKTLSITKTADAKTVTLLLPAGDADLLKIYRK